MHGPRQSGLGHRADRGSDKIQDSRVNLVKSTITNNALGGLHIQSAVATVASALFTRNIGYGLFVDGLASVTFNDQATPTQVSENTVGGILVKDSTLTLRGSALVQSNLGRRNPRRECAAHARRRHGKWPQRSPPSSTVARREAC